MAPRSRHALIAAGLAVLVAVAAGRSTPSTAQTTPPTSYLQNFNNIETTAPLDYAANGSLDVLVHSRDVPTWAGLEPMAMDHGSMCEAPPAQHASMDPMPYPDAVFVCNGHLMTSIKAGGYGVIYLTPGARVDFSGGESVISFDVSTLKTSGRDWWDVWVTPFDDLMAAPLPAVWPDLAGEPKNGIHIDTSMFNDQTVHLGSRLDNFVSTDLDSCWWCGTEQALAGVNLVPSASRRDTYELRISQTHVKFSLLNGTTHQPLMTWVDKDLSASPLSFSNGVVQIGHHSYNPQKECTPDPVAHICEPDTWHWDNLSISATAPLTIVPAQQIRADAAHPTLTFPTGAPSGAYLQLDALATDMDYSLDGGTTWAAIAKQSSNTHKFGGMRTYRQSIPTGTTSITLRGTEESGAWTVDHAAIYSTSGLAAPPTPTPAPPTATPIPPTATPVPPTATATPVPFTPIRINVGGSSYTDGASHVWAADTGCTSESVWAPMYAIAGTTDDTLYGSIRHGVTGPTCAFSVPNGTYTVTLKFAELYHTGTGARVENVVAEGATVLSNFDIVAAAGAGLTAVDRSFDVTVSDGTLNLAFNTVTDQAQINAIQIVQASAPTPTPVPPTATPVPPTSTPVPPTATPMPTDECRTHVRDRRSWSEVLHDWLPWTPEYASASCP
jgi:hypothetical protein